MSDALSPAAVPAPPEQAADSPTSTLSPAVAKFKSCRWRRPPEDGPECCGHRDVLPIAGTTGFDAQACYGEALRLNPTYPDAHFYLAVTLEKMGLSGEARPHWRAYQSLAPHGEWVQLAKEFSD